MNKTYNSLVASISKFLTNIFKSDSSHLSDGAAMRFDAYFNFDDDILISNFDRMFKILLDINEDNIEETYLSMTKIDFSNNWLQFWLIFIYCTKIRIQLIDFYEKLFVMMQKSHAVEYFTDNKKLLVDFSFFCHCFGFMNILISNKIIIPEDLNLNDTRFYEFFEISHDWKISFKVKSNDMIASAIRKDDVKFLIDNINDPLILLKGIECEQISMLKTASMAEYAAFYGSLRCLKYLKEIGDCSNCINFAIAGGNPEVIKYVEPHEEIDFLSVSMAIKFHHYHVFEWLSDKYSKESNNDWINDKKHKYLFFHKYQSHELILDEMAFKSRNNYNVTNLNRINNLKKANIHKYSPKRQKTQFQSNQFQHIQSNHECSVKVDIATSFGENIIDLLNIYREENHKLNEKLKSRNYEKKKIDPKTFCLAVISEGSRYSQIASIMNKLGIDIPSEREFFYVQKRIEINVTNFVRLDMFKWSLMLDSESSIAFDAAWMTRRNSRGAFSAFIELKSYKIIDYEWLFKGINYIGTSQHMEAEMFERMGERWKNDQRIKTLVHDNDTHTRSSLENKLHWKIDEKVDSNHLCNCFKRFIKSYVKNEFKETFKHISQNIIDFFIILMHDTHLTCLEKKEQWNNMINHLSGNHEKCRHAEKSNKEKWKYSNDKQHCSILLGFIQATENYFDKCDPLLTTQVCESLNSLKAKICEKQIAYSCSFPLRMAFVVMKWNNPELYYIELLKYLGLDQLTKKQEQYIIKKRDDYEKQSKNRNSEEYKKNRSKLRKKSRTKGKEQVGDHKYAEEEKDEDIKKKLSFINDEETPSYYLESSEDSFESEGTEENQNYAEEDTQDSDSSNSEMNYFGDDVPSSEIDEMFNKADSFEEEKCDDKVEGIDIKNFHPNDIGLIRPGVSCFIISILQSIIHQQTSMNFLYDDELVTSVYSDPISFPVLNSFFAFLTHYINAKKAISPKSLLSFFYKNQMDDAHGFLLQFLDNIESELIHFDKFKYYINLKYTWVLADKDEQNRNSRYYSIELPDDDIEVNLVDKIGEIIESVNYYPERLTFMINRSNGGYKYIKKNIVRLEENITLGGKNYNLSGVITFDIKALHYKYVRIHNKEVQVFDDSYCYQVTNEIKYNILLSQSYLVFYDLNNTV